MSEQAQALEAALKCLRKVVREFGIQDADDWVVAAIEKADELLAGEAPAEGVSPQPIDLDEAFIRGWGQGYLSLQGDTAEDVAMYRARDLDVFKRNFRPTPVSPVEPTPPAEVGERCILAVDSPCFPPETDEYRQCGCRACLKEYAKRTAGVEPTPEPSTEEALQEIEALRTLGNRLITERRNDDVKVIAAVVGRFFRSRLKPTGAPAPCVWREMEDGEGKWRKTVMRTTCGLREDADEMRPLSEWPFCAQCGHPLTVER